MDAKWPFERFVVLVNNICDGDNAYQLKQFYLFQQLNINQFIVWNRLISFDAILNRGDPYPLKSAPLNQGLPKQGACSHAYRPC